jgi:hypothetical protein
MKRKELIRKLLVTNHLNVPERQTFSDKPISIDEAKEIIKEELEKQKFFPPITDSWDNSKFYNEGLVIEQRGTKYILHEQVSGSSMNLLMDKETVFENIDEVIEKYLRPQNMNIDGITIAE